MTTHFFGFGQRNLNFFSFAKQNASKEREREKNGIWLFSPSLLRRTTTTVVAMVYVAILPLLFRMWRLCGFGRDPMLQLAGSRTTTNRKTGAILFSATVSFIAIFDRFSFCLFTWKLWFFRKKNRSSALSETMLQVSKAIQLLVFSILT